MDSAIGGAAMKAKSIFKRYMFFLMLGSLVFSALMIYIAYKNTSSYFKEETYRLMESSQENDGLLISNEETGHHMGAGNRRGMLAQAERRMVYKTLVKDQGINLELEGTTLRLNREHMRVFLGELEHRIEKAQFGRGEILIDGNLLLYSINQAESNAKNYVISSMWAAYSGEITQAMVGRTAGLSLLFLGFLWSVSFIFNRYMAQKFRVLNDNLEALENRNWQHFKSLNEDYETGRLNQKIDQVRGQLALYDQGQKEQFHAFSHELKTPIMIIKGYLDSIQSGLYPKGDLKASLEVVYEETEQMEQLIKNVLYLNKLEYLDQHYKPLGEIDLEPLIKHAVERFQVLGDHLQWELELSPRRVRGTEEQWQLIIDNLVSNQIRYAKTKIKIVVNDHQVTIGNDGEPIEADLLASLFEPFKKGRQGKTGLGLSIVKRLLALNGYRIQVKQEPCVLFCIEG